VKAKIEEVEGEPKQGEPPMRRVRVIEDEDESEGDKKDPAAGLRDVPVEVRRRGRCSLTSLMRT
jgi:hypothetical protein